VHLHRASALQLEIVLESDLQGSRRIKSQTIGAVIGSERHH
jgi:hypothetical protein